MHIVRSFGALAAVVIVGAVGAAAAGAHSNQTDPIKVPMTTYSTPVTYSATLKHADTQSGYSFTITMRVYFTKITTTSATIDQITFHYYNFTNGYCAGGGKADIYNSNKAIYPSADSGTTYCSDSTYTLPVNQTFTGGYAGGHIAITLDKLNNGFCGGFNVCDQHHTVATFYVP